MQAVLLILFFLSAYTVALNCTQIEMENTTKLIEKTQNDALELAKACDEETEHAVTSKDDNDDITATKAMCDVESCQKVFTLLRNLNLPSCTVNGSTAGQLTGFDAGVKSWDDVCGKPSNSIIKDDIPKSSIDQKTSNAISIWSTSAIHIMLAINIIFAINTCLLLF